MLGGSAGARLPVAVANSTSYPASSKVSSGPISSSPQYPHSERIIRILLLMRETPFWMSDVLIAIADGHVSPHRARRASAAGDDHVRGYCAPVPPSTPPPAARPARP